MFILLVLTLAFAQVGTARENPYKKNWGFPGGSPRSNGLEIEEQIITYDNFREAIRPFNYRWETFHVTTRDGYKLSMFRITGPIAKDDPDYHHPVPDGYDAEEYVPKTERIDNGKSILMMHGHNMDSEVWFEEKNMGKPMPLQLYDEGYDIWLGNHRGSNNCEHVPNRISPDNVQLSWDWSYAEMG